METNDATPERTIGQLVADAKHDVDGLLASQVALAKAEVDEGAATMKKSLPMFVGAGVLALYGLGFLFTTLAKVIAIWLPEWAGYLIVTAVIFLVCAILGLIGKKAIDNGSMPMPKRAIAEFKQTLATLRP